MNIVKSREFGSTAKVLTLEIGTDADVPRWARGMEICLHAESGSMSDRERFAKRLKAILALEFSEP